jgi:hypothetical protein
MNIGTFGRSAASPRSAAATMAGWNESSQNRSPAELTMKVCGTQCS